MKIDDISKIAHEANRLYCQSIGDNSQPPWEDAPPWQIESARVGVALHRDNPNATPRDSHESWLRQKREDGWKYGPVKDPAKKEHPCFVLYGNLPKEQQAKDALFAGICKALVPYLKS